MDFFKILSVACVTVFMCILLKRYSPEYAAACGIMGCVMLFLFSVRDLKNIFGSFFELASVCGINSEYITAVIKITGIAFAGQLSASFCRDAGESALASGVELCSCVIVMVLGMPVVKSLFSAVLSAASLGR